MWRDAPMTPPRTDDLEALRQQVESQLDDLTELHGQVFHPDVFAALMYDSPRLEAFSRVIGMAFLLRTMVQVPELCTRAVLEDAASALPQLSEMTRSGLGKLRAQASASVKQTASGMEA